MSDIPTAEAINAKVQNIKQLQAELDADRVLFIRHYRSHGWSQKKVALALGIGDNTVGRYEGEDTPPKRGMRGKQIVAKVSLAGSARS